MRLIPSVVTKIIKDEEVKNPSDLVNVTVERAQDHNDEITAQADRDLKIVFKELINTQSTFCVGTRDPIEDSFWELADGLRHLHERYDLDNFMSDMHTWSQKRTTEGLIAIQRKYNM